MLKSVRLVVLGVAALSLLCANPAAAQYKRRDLVSNIATRALHKDPNQINGWGLAFFDHSPFWVADNGSGVSTLYGPDGSAVPLVVTVPPAPSKPFGPTGLPTGLVANGSKDFAISKNGGNPFPALFIFDTEDGTISGWNPQVDPTNAVIAVDNSTLANPPFYTGLAIGTDGGRNFIYAADQANNKVDIYDGSFHYVKSFTDSTLSPGYSAFGIQNINGKLYVTFADFFNPTAAIGGFVDIFDTGGNFIKNFAKMGQLSLPWGLALAPSDFGEFSKDILVGNLGDGQINAFGLDGDYKGSLKDNDGQYIAIDGLWAIAFGTDPDANGPQNQLFFTAGPIFYAQGLFGRISVDDD